MGKTEKQKVKNVTMSQPYPTGNGSSSLTSKTKRKQPEDIETDVGPPPPAPRKSRRNSPKEQPEKMVTYEASSATEEDTSDNDSSFVPDAEDESSTDDENLDSLVSESEYEIKPDGPIWNPKLSYGLPDGFRVELFVDSSRVSIDEMRKAHEIISKVLGKATVNRQTGSCDTSMGKYIIRITDYSDKCNNYAITEGYVTTKRVLELLKEYSDFTYVY